LHSHFREAFASPVVFWPLFTGLDWTYLADKNLNGGKLNKSNQGIIGGLRGNRSLIPHSQGLKKLGRN
jgi:hypothetical protein